MTISDSEFDLRTYLDQEWLDRARAYMPMAIDEFYNPVGEKTRYGVESSTTRGMSLGGAEGAEEEGPLAAFEAWAEQEFVRLGLDGAGTKDEHRALWAEMNKSQSSFDAWHAGAVKRLCEHWKQRWLKIEAARLACGGEPRKAMTEADGSPRIAHKYKLVDLFVRRLRITAPRNSDLAQAVRNYGHIPLDRKSLALIGATVGHIIYGPSSSMGDIRTEQAYRTYQRLARVICSAIGGEATPILFDFFVWNSPLAKEVYDKPKSSEIMVDRSAAKGDKVHTLRKGSLRPT